LSGPRRISPITYGVVAGLLAVGVQIFGGVRPPPAYGICVACHTRDLVAWLANQFFAVNWELAPVSVALPVLTTIGLLLGAHLAARRHKEYRPTSLGSGLRSFICGIVVVNAAIIALGCPTRLLLLTAYGDTLALLAAVGVVLGISAGTFVLARGWVR
jgi:hypothetical protein